MMTWIQNLSKVVIQKAHLKKKPTYLSKLSSSSFNTVVEQFKSRRMQFGLLAGGYRGTQGTGQHVAINGLVGDYYSEDWRTNKYALLVALAAPSPESLARPGLGPIFTTDFAGIPAPIQSIATIEYFPFGRISG
jgi:hypothetical protein